MFKIVNETVESLHEISVAVTTPLSDEDKKLALDLYQYVVNSQDEEYVAKHNIRPAVGIASPQVGINKRMFAINYQDEKIQRLIIINPKILSTNKTQVYLNNGEGCLSVDRTTTGVVPRYSKITVEGLVYDFDHKVFNKKKMVLKDYFAIVFQHEYDHLDGILYVDKLLEEEKAIENGILSLWEEEKEVENNTNEK